MTEQEKELLELLGKCYVIFAHLPVYHPADAKEFAVAIHACQNIVFARMGMRDYGYSEHHPMSIFDWSTTEKQDKVKAVDFYKEGELD